MKRLLLLFLLLAILVVIPFLVWGDYFESQMSLDRTVAWLQDSGDWAWLAGLLLLIVDLFLPILGTVVMSALGLIYGWLVGGLLGALGSFTSGVLAYGLCRCLGRRIGRLIAGEKGLSEGERIFQSEGGGWLVALSRWMPILPEVIACLAGMTRMPFAKFCAALCAGSIPMAFVFAWIGARGNAHPQAALLASIALPPLLWGLFRFFYFTGSSKSGKNKGRS